MQSIDVNGAKLAFVDEGEGPPVVFAAQFNRLAWTVEYGDHRGRISTG